MFNKEFICQFDVDLYPFDTQKCRAIIELTGNSDNFVKLEKYLEYTGTTDIQSYVVRSIHLLPDGGEGSMVIEVILGRRVLNDIMTINLPTLILVLVRWILIFVSSL